MNPSHPPSTHVGRDLFSLASASIEDLVEALLEAEVDTDDDYVVPPRDLQVAELVLAEAVRLIRLAASTDLTEAAFRLAQFLITPKGAELKERRPDVYEFLNAASLSLGSAAAPSSAGSELSVLRSWNGNALRAVTVLSRSSKQVLERSELRERLGDVDESYLSHLLADLEAAGLVCRVREGRTVTVHLGPMARQDHVRQLIPEKPQIPWASHHEEGLLTAFLDSQIHGASKFTFTATLHHNREPVSAHWKMGEVGFSEIASGNEHEYELDAASSILGAPGFQRRVLN